MPVDTPPELSGRKPRRYDEMEHHELIHLMDEVNDERARARFRESIYISIIIWMAIGWFLIYGPKVLFHQGKIITFVDALKDRQDLKYLDLPPDALKKIPKHTDIISDQDRVAQTKRPTLDKKTLDQLQAMQRSGPPAPQQAPPAPTPQPQPQQQAPAPSAPQPQPQQAQQPPPPAPQPQQQNLPSLPQTPPPQQQASNTRPTFNQNASTGFGNLVKQGAQAARSGGGNYGANAAPQHPGLAAGAEILSDTMGVDFGPYMKRLRADIQRNWDPLIPESVRAPILKQGVTGIRFVIMADGKIGNILLETKSGDVALDKAAWGAITGEGQFPPLPKEFKGPYLELRCGFFYNMPVQ